MRSFVVLLALLGVVASVAILKPQKANNALCGMCEMLVQELETDVENGEPDLEKKANTYCDDMFKQGMLDSFCKMMVDKELENIVTKLENDEKPDVICADIKMCDKPQKA